MKVTLLYFEGCPHWQRTDAVLELLAEEIPGLEIGRQTITTPEEAEATGFRGSPSVLIDGVDAFFDESAPVGLTCRVYQTPAGFSGSPTLEQLRERLTRR